MRRLLSIGVIIGLVSISMMSYYSWKRSLFFKKHDQFSEWYAANFGDKPEAGTVDDTPTVHTFEYNSATFHIDTIFRSMQGPLSAQPIQFNVGDSKLSRFFSGNELYWLVGYRVDVIDAGNGKKCSDDFMCHNNLDIQNKQILPWQIPAKGNFARVFTLTEGQTKTMLPKGFGVPILSNTTLVVGSQVLNHNCPVIDMKVKHKVTIYYVKESELKTKMHPLYQQAGFVTRFVSGPPGEYGEAINAFGVKDTSLVSIVSVSPKEDTCCTGKVVNGDYDPYHDAFGRIFTGHWKFGPGVEVLKTNVTRTLDIKYDTKVHYIGVHVHPFCTSLELVDLTSGKSIFKANNEVFPDKIGMKYIDHFESKEGVPVFKDHQYQLISTYNNTTKDIHTAMATMFLYLEQK